MSTRYYVHWRRYSGEWEIIPDAFRWLWRARRFVARRVTDGIYASEWRIRTQDGKTVLWVRRLRPEVGHG